MQLSHESSEQNLRNAIRLLEDAIARDLRSLERTSVSLMFWSGWAIMDMRTSQRRSTMQWLSPEGVGASTVVGRGSRRVGGGLFSTRTGCRVSVRGRNSGSGANPNIAELTAHLDSHTPQKEDSRTASPPSQALELDPLSVYHARTMALVMGVAGRADEANALMSRMQQLFPDNFLVYLGLATHTCSRETS